MSSLVDLFGIEHGKLVPVGAFKEKGCVYWNCLCKCGLYVRVEQDDLVDKSINACPKCTEESNKKEVLISVRLPDDLMEKLEYMCKSSGQTKSQFIRKLISAKWSDL